MSRHLRGVLILVLVTLLWGTTFVVVKTAETQLAPSLLMLIRFGLATLVFLPFLRPRSGLWVIGLELGLWLWLGYATQAVGLRHTSASRSAFITSMNVIFVPLLAAIGGRRISGVTWLAALIAAGGAGLLTYDGAPPNIGDLWTAATAVVYALYILRLESFASRFNSLSLTAFQLLGVLAFSAVWASADHPAPSHPMPWLALLYLGVATTALTTWLQTLGQKSVSAPQAAIIFTLEPVWASICAFIYLHERFGPRGWIGAIAILAATLMSQAVPGGTPAPCPALPPVPSPAPSGA